MTCVPRLEDYEEKLREEYGSSGDNVVTVSGLVGVGSSTVAEILKEELDLELVSSGQFFRKKAKEKGMELTEFFEKYRNPDKGPDPDLMWDRRALNLAFTKDDIILEGRMTGPLLCDIADVRVLVKCSKEVVVERFAEREGLDQSDAERRLEKRNSQDIKTYREKYGIDVTDEKYYNVVVDNSGTPEETKEAVLQRTREILEE
ncbi:MAG: (d)CMP kinase [Candidatus Aenigmatarchaeota archaeon]